MSTALLPTTVNAAEYTSNGAITFEADPNQMDQTLERLDHYRSILLQAFNLATN